MVVNVSFKLVFWELFDVPTESVRIERYEAMVDNNAQGHESIHGRHGQMLFLHWEEPLSCPAISG